MNDNEIAELTAEIEELTAQRDAKRALKKELLFTEDLSNGISHAQEIFETQHEILRLDTEILLRSNRLKAINSGWLT
ncbi:hypothetical protein [Desulfovibrio inopinatus]|uniref:hypothetical protein n=1 Tax=Desulfovibrio inopinatus TaxID=102109 RepID=UPI0004080D5F|nr:hypothetical protein [Desulfovibrio inopinatus]